MIARTGSKEATTHKFHEKFKINDFELEFVSAKGLKELEIVVIPLVLAKDGRRISSTRIRNKEINIEGSKA